MRGGWIKSCNNRWGSELGPSKLWFTSAALSGNSTMVESEDFWRGWLLFQIDPHPGCGWAVALVPGLETEVMLCIGRVR